MLQKSIPNHEGTRRNSGLDWSLDEQQGQEIVRTVERSNQQQYL